MGGAFGNVNWLDGWSAMTFATGSSTALTCANGDITSAAASSGGGGASGGVDPDAVPGWGVGLFVGFGILIVLLCVMVSVMTRQEKIGKPIFLPMPMETTSTKKDVEMASAKGSA